MSAGLTLIEAGANVFPTTVTSLTVPAGNHVIWATGDVHQVIGSDQYLECTLTTGSAIATQDVQVNSDNVAAYSNGVLD